MVTFITWVLLFPILIIVLQLQFCSTSTQKAYPNVSCIARERRALLQLRSSLVDRSNRLSSWSGEDCCNWEGIACNKSTGHVVRLDLRNPILMDSRRNYLDPNYSAAYMNSCLAGEINPSLLALKHLNYLDLSMNNFFGMQIPTFLGSLGNLKYLNLSGAGFQGKIPQVLGNLSRLQHLDLSSFNNYGGEHFTATSLSWLAKLSSLNSLDLTATNLSECQDWFQSINMLPSLRSLTLFCCDIVHYSHSLPLLNLTSLTSLNLGDNYINTTIPLWLFNMTSLKVLDLSWNYIHGPIPAVVSSLTSLAYLSLHDNDLCSPVPNSFASLSSLDYLDLTNNHFVGSLPLALLGKLTSLSVMLLHNNKFHGAISPEIGHLRMLRVLGLGENKLNGTISSELGVLSNLVKLDISANSLMGEISEVHFAKLQKLKYLHLSSNPFTLNLKSSWIPPFQLQLIEINFVKIGPQFPSWLRTQKKLDFLTMRNASISDNIPPWFEIVHSHITFLDLSLNNITGKVPKFIGDNKSFFSIEGLTVWGYRWILLFSNRFRELPSQFPSNIIKLDLSRNLLTGPIPLSEDLAKSVSWFFLYLNHNKFNGSIPESICLLRRLRILDLSNNQLSGRLPLCLGNLRRLVKLDVANNSLYGQIPNSLGHLELLKSLHLNNNKFQGELPSSLQYLKYMVILDLGENELEGVLPSWIGESLSYLRLLRLQSNKFYGDISLQLCQLSYLEVLNLAQNSLTGCIPQCFNNFSVMGLNFSQSRDPLWYMAHSTGEPEFSDNLWNPKSLDLSGNNLVGDIPNELMDLVGLQILKLSRNHLSGTIPDKIGDMKQLISLDLSVNELSGSIPASLANINFLSYLNLSSNKLSGRIPTDNQLQTLEDPSTFAGNSGLCGKPLPISCSNKESSQGNEPTSGNKDDKESGVSWFFAGLATGFAVSSMGIFCILLFKKSWRYAYFELVENLSNNIWVWIAPKTSELGRKLQ